MRSNWNYELRLIIGAGPEGIEPPTKVLVRTSRERLDNIDLFANRSDGDRYASPPGLEPGRAVLETAMIPISSRAYVVILTQYA